MIEDVNAKLQPGLTILSWTSMNIDSFRLSVEHGLARLEELGTFDVM